MGRRWIHVVTLVAVAVGVASGPAAGAATTAPGATRRTAIDRVLIVTVPGVGWRDLDRAHTPVLRGFVEDAAVADLATRAPRLRNQLADNYASLGAGDKALGADAQPDVSGIAPAGAAYRADEMIGGVRASDVFARRTGTVTGSALVVLGLEQILSANSGSPYHAEVGQFGDALARAGWQRAVIANGDGVDAGSAAVLPRRAAATALMDPAGTVPGGDLAGTLLAEDPVAPFGRRLDPDAVERAFTAAWQPHAVVLVEGSDLVRAAEYRGTVGRRQARAQRSAALQATDALAGRLLAHVDPARDAVVVLGTAPNPADGRLAAVAVRAPGVPAGLLRSGTTERTGFVQIMDVAPSVLALLGVEAPATMRGRPAAVADLSGDAESRRRFLVDADTAAAFRSEIQTPVALLLVALATALVVAAGIALLRPRGAAPLVAEWTALVTLAFLPVVYLSRAVPFPDLGAPAYWAFLAVGTVALAAVAHAVGGRLRWPPAVMLVAVSVLVLAADVTGGTPLQFNGALGFSPEVAGRFVGFGNAGYAIFAAGALVLAVVVARGGRRRDRVLAIAILLAAIVVDGAPMWGADVGGVLSVVPAFAVAGWRVAGRRLRVRTVLLALGATGVAVVAAVVVDLSRPATSQTHLARLVRQVQGEGGGELVDTVVRKLLLNLSSFTSGPFRWLFPVVVIGGVALWWLPGRVVPTAVRSLDPTGALRLGFPLLLVLGFALNDTGILVPALMLLVLIGVLVPDAVRAAAEEPAGPARARRPVTVPG